MLGSSLPGSVSFFGTVIQRSGVPRGIDQRSTSEGQRALRGRTFGHRKEFLTGLSLGMVIISLNVMLARPLLGERFGASSISLDLVAMVVSPQSPSLRGRIPRSESRPFQGEGTSPSESRSVLPRELALQWVSTVAVAERCGLFVWVGRDWLLVDAAQRGAGTWLVNVVSGERRRIAAWFGLAVKDIIAVRNPHRRRTELYSWDDTLWASIDTRQFPALPDPTGRRAVWRVVEEQTEPSFSRQPRRSPVRARAVD